MPDAPPRPEPFTPRTRAAAFEDLRAGGARSSAATGRRQQPEGTACGLTVSALSDNGTMVGVKEPNRASLTPLVVPMSLGAGHGNACTDGTRDRRRRLTLIACSSWTTRTWTGDPDALLAEHAGALDAAYREVAGRLAVNTEVTIGDDGKIHLTGFKAVEEPPSPTDLRKRTPAMLPRVDLPEVILEVMSWAPEVAAAFTAASGGRTRLDDLPTSIAACLAARAMNVGYRPIAKKGVPALERSGCRTSSRTTSGPRLWPP